MAVRLVLLLALLLSALAACEQKNDAAKKTAIDEMERRHAEDMVRMGGGGM